MLPEFTRAKRRVLCLSPRDVWDIRRKADGHVQQIITNIDAVMRGEQPPSKLLADSEELWCRALDSGLLFKSKAIQDWWQFVPDIRWRTSRAHRVHGRWTENISNSPMAGAHAMWWRVLPDYRRAILTA